MATGTVLKTVERNSLVGSTPISSAKYTFREKERHETRAYSRLDKDEWATPRADN